MLPRPAARNARPAGRGPRDDPQGRRRSAGARRPSRRGDEPRRGARVLRRDGARRLAGGRAGATARRTTSSSSMGDKSYLALTAGWLAHCLYALGRYDEADEFAVVCENAAARSWVAAQVSLAGGASAAARARGRGRGGRGACQGGGRSRAPHRPGRYADGRAHGPRRGAAGGWPRRPRRCRSSRTRCGGTSGRRSFRPPPVPGRSSRSWRRASPRKRSRSDHLDSGTPRKREGAPRRPLASLSQDKVTARSTPPTPGRAAGRSGRPSRRPRRSASCRARAPKSCTPPPRMTFVLGAKMRRVGRRRRSGSTPFAPCSCS